MTRPFRTRRCANALLGAGLGGSALVAFALPSSPAQAIIVFDPGNYSQNILTAAHTLQQINNQIRMLQNQAQSLINQAKNLTTISFPELDAIRQTLAQIDQLMGQAQAIQFRVATLDQQFHQTFPITISPTLPVAQQAAAAKARLETAMSAFEQTMTVQAQVAENVQADTSTLTGVVSRSQGAEGSLQAQQAANQLLALTAKQLFQIQNLMAAQYRADAIEHARAAQAQSDARAAATKFLGSGSAYTPQ